jgi:hypothetical protein
MRSAVTVCTLFVALSLFGCADLEVYQLRTNDNAPLVGGMSYYLPRTAITLSLTVALNSCETKFTDKTKTTYQINVDSSASLTPVASTEPDPDYHYYISYEKSRSWMKEINFSVTNNASGTLQSFNNTINDQAGPDMVAAIGAAVQIGGAVTLHNIGPPTEAPSPLAAELLQRFPPDDCSKYLTKGVNETLKNIAKDKADKKKITDNPATGASEVAAQTQAIQAIQAKIDKETKTLTRSFSYKWIPSRRDTNIDSDQYVLIEKEIGLRSIVEKWFSESGQAWLNTRGIPTTDARYKLRSPFLVALAVLKSSMDRPMEPEIDDGGYPTSLQPLNGLVIRDPAAATLRICREVDPGCVAGAAVQADNELVETTTDNPPRMALRIPQFGRVLMLTEKSGPFENATLNAKLNADGTIDTIGYHAASTLATAIGGVGTAAGNASTALAAQNTAIAAKNTAAAAVTTATTAQVQAPDTYNKALADCLSQSATIVKAGGTPVPCK